MFLRRLPAFEEEKGGTFYTTTKKSRLARTATEHELSALATARLQPAHATTSELFTATTLQSTTAEPTAPPMVAPTRTVATTATAATSTTTLTFYDLAKQAFQIAYTVAWLPPTSVHCL